jgi:hypothetical protein
MVDRFCDANSRARRRGQALQSAGTPRNSVGCPLAAAFLEGKRHHTRST